MTRFRTERMRAARHEAELQWSICPQCRHVRLDRWSLSDPEDSAGEQTGLGSRGR